MVEDDAKIVELVSTYLTNWGFDVTSVQDFQHVTEEIQAANPDLILMDINLPYFSGYHWTQEVRKSSTTPIIFLSSQDDNLNMVMAMNMGADDFISKPFQLDYLVAKVQALLRRTYAFKGPDDDLSFEGATLNLEDGRISKNDTDISLTKNELKILHLLFKKPNQIVTKEDIMEKLWESEDFVDANTLSVNITRLRKKLAEIDFAKHVQTIKGRGYMLASTED
jgi:DNA-binding response OmpR family regulator